MEESADASRSQSVGSASARIFLTVPPQQVAAPTRLGPIANVPNETISPVPRLSSGVLGFPDFRGFTRALILWNLASYFGLLIIGVISRPIAGLLVTALALDPNQVLHHGWIWQLLPYCIIHPGAAVLGTAFELLSLWFLGSMLEGLNGPRWLAELFFVSVLGAGLAAVALSFAMPGSGAVLYGCFGGIFGLLIAIGVLYADTPFMMFPFPVTIKGDGHKVKTTGIVTPATYNGSVFTPPKLSGYFVAKARGRKKITVTLTATLLGFPLSNTATARLNVTR